MNTVIKGIGSTRMRHAEEALQSAGIHEILLGKDPWHYFPGVPLLNKESWFEERGYQAFGKEYDMLCKYEDEDTKVLPSLDNVEFSQLDLE